MCFDRDDPWKVHFILNSKGGVGKSFIAISAACISGAVAIAGPIFLETQSAYADCRLAKP
jgi:hypothetical protein